MSEIDNIIHLLKNRKPDYVQQKELFKELHNKYSGYLSLSLDVRILMYMIGKNLELNTVTYIRQVDIIKAFSDLSPECIRRHLRTLSNRGLIKDVYWRGAYSINVSRVLTLAHDLNKLLECLLGKEIYLLLTATFNSQAGKK